MLPVVVAGDVLASTWNFGNLTLAFAEQLPDATRCLAGDAAALFEQARATLEATPPEIERADGMLTVRPGSRIVDRNVLRALDELSWVVVTPEAMHAVAVTGDVARLAALGAEALLVHAGRILKAVPTATLAIARPPKVIDGVLDLDLPGLRFSRDGFELVSANGHALKLWFAGEQIVASLDGGEALPFTRVLRAAMPHPSDVLGALTESVTLELAPEGQLMRPFSDHREVARFTTRLGDTVIAPGRKCSAAKAWLAANPTSSVEVARDEIIGLTAASDHLDPASDEVWLEAGEIVTEAKLAELVANGSSSITVVAPDLVGECGAAIVRTLRGDGTSSHDEEPVPPFELTEPSLAELRRLLWHDDLPSTLEGLDWIRVLGWFFGYRRSEIAHQIETGQLEPTELRDREAQRAADAQADVDRLARAERASFTPRSLPVPTLTTSRISTLAFASDGEPARDVAVNGDLVAALGRDGTLRILSLSEGRERARWTVDSIGATVRWLDDTRVLTSGERQSAAVWDVRAREGQTWWSRDTLDVSDLHLSPDRRLIAGIERHEWFMGVWNVPPDREELVRVPRHNGVSLEGFTGSQLVTFARSELVLIPWAGGDAIRVRPIRVNATHGALSHGAQLATFSGEDGIELRSIHDGEPRWTVQAPAEHLRLRFSPDDSRLWAASPDANTGWIYDIATGAQLATLPGCAYGAWCDRDSIFTSDLRMIRFDEASR